jgi:hypothetical protein
VISGIENLLGGWVKILYLTGREFALKAYFLEGTNIPRNGGTQSPYRIAQSKPSG